MTDYVRYTNICITFPMEAPEMTYIICCYDMDVRYWQCYVLRCTLVHHVTHGDVTGSTVTCSIELLCNASSSEGASSRPS